jgi:uncharacterized protein (TIGR02271 family)
MANTRNPIDRARLRQGMQVYSGEGQRLGPIERIDADSIIVAGQQYEFNAIERLEGDRVSLTRQVGASPDRARGAAAAGTAGAARGQVVEAEGQVRVPVREERLEVDKRPTELGAVEVRTTVEAEQQTVPVEVTREEVHVEQRDVADRPATEAETAGAFREGTIRVPVRGEEAVARKETVVTGEVVIDKERTTETQEVAETVRRERVDVDEDAPRAAAPAAGAPAAGAAGVGGAGRRDVAVGAEVVGADGAPVGRVKEVRAADFLVDRRGQRDVYVPFAAVAEAAANRLRLTVPADAVDDQGWPQPPLL